MDRNISTFTGQQCLNFSSAFSVFSLAKWQLTVLYDVHFIKHFYKASVFYIYEADTFIELSDSIISVTTSYAKLRKLSKKCCHLVCQAEQTSSIYLLTLAAVS